MSLPKSLKGLKNVFLLSKFLVRQVAESGAFKVAGGGDTHRILTRLNLWKKFDFVSVGGGAMLYYLKEENLPGIEALNR